MWCFSGVSGRLFGFYFVVCLGPMTHDDAWLLESEENTVSRFEHAEVFAFFISRILPRPMRRLR